MKFAVWFSPAVLFGIAATALAQQASAVSGDSARTNLAARLSFARVLEVFHWQAQAAYSRLLHPQTIFRFGENFLSSLHRLSDDERWKDEQTATLGVDFRWLGVPAQVQGQSRVFRDQVSSFNGNYRHTSALLRGNYRAAFGARELELRPGVGYFWESRLGQADHGPHLELAARVPELVAGGYTHQLDAAAATERYPSRKNEDLRFQYGLSRQFYADTSDSLFLNVVHFRRDNYVRDQGFLRVEQLSKQTRGVENRLRYRLSENGRLALRSLVQQSRVAVRQTRLAGDASASAERAHEDFDVQHALAVDWRGQRFSTGFELRFEQQTVKFNIPDSVSLSPFSKQFVIIRYNVRDRTFSLAQRSRWQPSRRDSLRLSMSVARFARDTSERIRPDSYDNLRAQVNLTHYHAFRRGLALRWQLSGYADHLVYLKSAFSATNNWTRILQLAPQILMNLGERLQASQRFGVRAHYVTYDFEDIPGTPRSFSSRTFFAQDSLAAQLTRRSSLALNYQLEIEEIGTLNWDEFKTRPQFTRHRHWLFLSFDHALAARWRFLPGVRFYQQTQWRHEVTPRGPARRRDGQVTSVGPQVKLLYERLPRAALLFQAEQQLVFATGAPRQNQYYFNLTVQWSL
jgi:hypothetical protein